MTREEQTDWLCRLRADLNNGVIFTPWNKEFTEALTGILEQEQKTGHWEWVQYDYNPKIGNWHCSECRCIVVECVGKEEKGGIPLYKYCPQCSIKMKSQESEDV